MLVALAVSSIILIASYASYDLVATQYRKNIDIADMHTSGRAIMRIIERDVRMAGFEYRDKDAKVTYGTISNPLTIKDSGNKCCDEVTVIYDYYDEESKKAERIRIRYWAGPHTSNKGSRHRLYKQKDILGQNKKILAKPKLGTKDVMADYIEDLQIVNVVNLSNLYIINKYAKQIDIYDTVAKKQIGYIKHNNVRRATDITAGKDGFLYTTNNKLSQIDIWDPVAKKHVGHIKAEVMYNITSGNDGYLYTHTANDKINIYDPVAKKKIGFIKRDGYGGAITAGQDGYIYINNGQVQQIDIYDPVAKKKIGFIKNVPCPGDIRAAKDGYIYSTNGCKGQIDIYDPVVKKKIGFIKNRWATGVITSGKNGYLYTTNASGPQIDIWDPVAKKQIGYFKIANEADIAAFTKSTGQESLVTINLTLRTKNQYGKDRQFKKKDYHAGNYKLDKTDKYKRDTFSSTVLVRNLAL
jgi:hypothetical protein